MTNVGKTRAATFSADLQRDFGPLPPPLLQAYPHATDPQARAARLDLERDLRFGWDMWAWARLQAAAHASPVYSYRFIQRPPFPSGLIRAGWGASHFAELWYMFDHLDQEPWAWTAGDRRLAATMAQYWLNFAAAGDPNGAGLPPWPAFDMTRHQVQQLDDPIRPGPIADMKQLRVFDSVYDGVRQSKFGKAKP